RGPGSVRSCPAPRSGPRARPSCGILFATRRLVGRNLGSLERGVRMATPVNELPAVDPDSGRINVVVDTPRGSRTKYKFDEQHGQWRLSKVLPQGMYFPYDFGF